MDYRPVGIFDSGMGGLTAVRVLLGTGFVSALFCLYALIAFKPFRGLK